MAGRPAWAHGSDYVVKDYSIAVVTAAKALAASVVDLLSDGADQAGKIISSHKRTMTKSEYLSFMRGLSSEELFESDQLVPVVPSFHLAHHLEPGLDEAAKSAGQGPLDHSNTVVFSDDRE